MNEIENKNKNGNEIDKKNEMNEYAKWKDPITWKLSIVQPVAMNAK